MSTVARKRVSIIIITIVTVVVFVVVVVAAAAATVVVVINHHSSCYLHSTVSLFYRVSAELSDLFSARQQCNGRYLHLL